MGDGDNLLVLLRELTQFHAAQRIPGVGGALWHPGILGVELCPLHISVAFREGEIVVDVHGALATGSDVAISCRTSGAVGRQELATRVFEGLGTGVYAGVLGHVCSSVVRGITGRGHCGWRMTGGATGICGLVRGFPNWSANEQNCNSSNISLTIENYHISL